ncbi:MAG: FG-GAP repeat domain-containing protein [Planctomycetota bacterium]
MPRSHFHASPFAVALLLVFLAGCTPPDDRAPAVTGIVAEPGPGVVNGPDVDGDYSTQVSLGNSLGLRINAAHPDPAADYVLSVVQTSGLTPAQAGFDQPFPTASGSGDLSILLDGSAATAGTITLVIEARDANDHATTTTIAVEIVDVAVAVEVTTQPVNAQAYATISSVTVRLINGIGNTVTATGVDVSVDIGANAGSPAGVLTGTLTRPTTAGVVVFDDLSIDQPGSGYTLMLSSAGLTDAETGTFDIIDPGTPPTNTAVIVDPGPAQLVGPDVNGKYTAVVVAGYPLGFRVQASHLPGIPYVLQVYATTGLTPVEAGFDQPFDTANGPGATELVLSGTASTVGTIALGIESRDVFDRVDITVLTIDIVPPPFAVEVLGQPAATTAAAVPMAAVSARLVDSFGTPVVLDNIDITVAIGVNAGSPLGVLTGTLTQPSTAGVVTFTNLAIDEPGSGYTLVFSSSGLNDAESDPFDVIGSDAPFVTGVGYVGASGVIEITYTLVHADSPRSDVQVEYDADTGDANDVWLPASQAPTAPGVEGSLQRSSSPGGVVHSYFWESSRDLPGVDSTIKVRVRTVVPTALGVWAEGAGHAIANSAAPPLPTLFAGPRRLTSVPAIPTSASGDFNADGKTDCIVKDASNIFRVLFGDGTGGWVDSGFTVPFAATTRVVRTADLDKDGHIDLVASRYTSGYSVALGLGTGQFAAPVPYTPGGTGRAEIGDINGDGWLDILFMTGSTLRRCLQDSANPGTFTLAGSEVGVLLSANAFADVNGDGRIDQIREDTSSDEADVRLGQPDGTFGAAMTIAALVNRPALLACGDMDGDGLADVMTMQTDLGTREWILRSFLSNGDGTFTEGNTTLVNFEVGIGLEYPIGEYFNTIRDMDGDGLGDLVGVTTETTIWKGDGTGTFTASGVSPGYDSDHTGEHVDFGDFNGDGLIDVLVDGAAVLQQPGAPGTFFRPGVVTAPVDTAGKVLAADMDGDNVPDLVVSATPVGGPGIRVWRQSSPRVFEQYGEIAAEFATDMDAADLNGDDLGDIVVVNQSTSELRVYFQDTANPGTFLAFTAFAAPSTVRGLQIADVDGDTHLDVAVATDSGLSVYYGDGAGNLSRQDIATNAMRAVRCADLDANGLRDLVGTGSGISVVRQVTASPRTFHAVDTYTGAGSTPHCLVIADTDMDNRPDVLLATTNQLNIYINNPASPGHLLSASVTAISPDSANLAAADLNGDGLADIVLGDDSGNGGLFYFQVLFQRSDIAPGSFEQPVQYVMYSSGTAPSLVDLDNDGHLDLLMAQYNTSPGYGAIIWGR